jgi:hypothetical protein
MDNNETMRMSWCRGSNDIGVDSGDGDGNGAVSMSPSLQCPLRLGHG